jgi:hypothetical protein
MSSIHGVSVKGKKRLEEIIAKNEMENIPSTAISFKEKDFRPADDELFVSIISSVMNTNGWNSFKWFPIDGTSNTVGGKEG